MMYSPTKLHECRQDELNQVSLEVQRVGILSSTVVIHHSLKFLKRYYALE